MRRAQDIAILLSLAVLAAPRVQAARSEGAFSHDCWSAVLARFVDERGLVDYESLAAERSILDRYLASIQAVSPRSHPHQFPGRCHALAYYLNAYNALVFRNVLARGPEKESVWKGGLISGYRFFVAAKVTLGGETMSLKGLEDRIIRMQFQDPRVHAALNCASLGCPRLPQKAFDPERLDEELDAAMREFVSDPRQVRIDRHSSEVHLSRIFDWFREDFLHYERRAGCERPSLIDYVNRYRAPGDEIPRGYRVRFLEYDKRINRQRPGASGGVLAGDAGEEIRAPGPAHVS